ncbi:hypothetical protein J8I26_07240 [Herbaspirillum sp. LeCh32-8]|nr:hypothetical protein [Herbaspirillum sp. LeCh32-8]
MQSITTFYAKHNLFLFNFLVGYLFANLLCGSFLHTWLRAYRRELVILAPLLSIHIFLSTFLHIQSEYKLSLSIAFALFPYVAGALLFAGRSGRPIPA